MEEPKPKSIKNIGLLVAVISGFIILSNGMGALAWSVIGIGDDFTSIGIKAMEPLTFLITHYLGMCLIMLLIGTAYLVGGVFIRKYKMWANIMVSSISVLIFYLSGDL